MRSGSLDNEHYAKVEERESAQEVGRTCGKLGSPVQISEQKTESADLMQKHEIGTNSDAKGGYHCPMNSLRTDVIM